MKLTGIDIMTHMCSLICHSLKIIQFEGKIDIT